MLCFCRLRTVMCKSHGRISNLSVNRFQSFDQISNPIFFSNLKFHRVKSNIESLIFILNFAHFRSSTYRNIKNEYCWLVMTVRTAQLVSLSLRIGLHVKPQCFDSAYCHVTYPSVLVSDYSWDLQRFWLSQIESRKFQIESRVLQIESLHSKWNRQNDSNRDLDLTIADF